MSYLNSIDVTVNDLKPDTIYTIGVLLIMDDAYFNENDIVYGQYRTKCECMY